METRIAPTMSFKITLSLAFSINLRKGATCERHRDQPVSSEEHMRLPTVTQPHAQPAPKVEVPVAVNTPVRPVFPRSARNSRKEIAAHNDHASKTTDTHIADTPSSKASDSESLVILLRSSAYRERQASATKTGTADELSDSSLDRHSPVESLDTIPEDPFVSNQSPVLEDVSGFSDSSDVQHSPVVSADTLPQERFKVSHSSVLEHDSGSDLVSPLQRLSVGGLSSYFLDKERRSSMPMSSSATAHVVLEHDVEADQSTRGNDMDDGEWDEVKVDKTNEEELAGGTVAEKV